MDKKDGGIGSAFRFSPPKKIPRSLERAAYFLAEQKAYGNDNLRMKKKGSTPISGHTGWNSPQSMLSQFRGMDGGARWSNPIDFLRLHHCMQVDLSALVAVIADDMGHPHIQELARTAFDYLVWEMPHHHAHETIDLPEALENGEGMPADTCELFEMLETNHCRDRKLTDAVLEDLGLLARGRYPESPQKFSVRLLQLSGSLHRHVAWENQVVLPLIENRLSIPARRRLLLKISARRGTRNALLDGSHRP